MSDTTEISRIAIQELDEVKAKDLTTETLVLVSNPSLNAQNPNYISKKINVSNLSTYLIGDSCLSLYNGLEKHFLWDGYYEEMSPTKLVLSCNKDFFINAIELNKNGVPISVSQDTVKFSPSNYGGGLLSTALTTETINLIGNEVSYEIKYDGWVSLNGEIVENSSEKACTEIFLGSYKLAQWNNVGAFDGIESHNYASSGMPIAAGTTIQFKKSNGESFISGSTVVINYFKLNGVYQEKSLSNYVLKSDAHFSDSDQGTFVTHVVEENGIIKTFKKAIPASTDTTNTTGALNNTNAKMFLIGAESQIYSPVTKSNSQCYIGTDNCLYSNSAKVITQNSNNTVATSGSYTDLQNKPEIDSKNKVIDAVYPVGSIYLSLVNTNPRTLFGTGTWQKIASGRCLWGANENGSDLSTMVEAGLPQHTHNINRTFLLSQGSYTYLNNGEFAKKINGYSDVVTDKATDSNSIYGASETVQPPALIVNMWQRVS